MRLIDANKLPRTHKVMLDGRMEAFENEWVSAYAIDNAPTVEAVPVEWMKKFANARALNDDMGCYWHFWGTDLLQMIELWRKENGKAD